ncbi:NIPSNAP family protein [Falsiroseomonas oryzae]|uniref:NIPSNAP family protein n=1 Tax=Falsiroseomonas oryzae TaxID=2766473 RepID=UPI0022EAC666|nr:NIPSNAP family protein [Roseomonas sp. MO-31]
MIADVRIYTTLPNRLPEFVALYEAKAWPLQLKYLENCLGWYTTVEGELNTVVHIWGYADQGDRERRRNAMAADPAWGAYLKEAGERGLLLKMENRIARPTGFFTAFQAQRRG